MSNAGCMTSTFVGANPGPTPNWSIGGVPSEIDPVIIALKRLLVKVDLPVMPVARTRFQSRQNQVSSGAGLGGALCCVVELVVELHAVRAQEHRVADASARRLFELEHLERVRRDRDRACPDPG